jgi:hypothetical protein
MKSAKFFLTLTTIFISEAAFAQFGNLGDAIKNQVQNALQKAQQPSNQQSGNNVLQKNIADYQNQNADSQRDLNEAVKDRNKPQRPNSVKSNQILDIKGIKMLMPQKEAVDMIVSHLKKKEKNACNLAKLDGNAIELWEIGDQALICGNDNFQFFGRDVNQITAVFDEGKLVFVSLRIRSAPADTSAEPMPDFYKALADKFTVAPKINSVKRPRGDLWDFVSSIQGSDGALIELQGLIRGSMSGASFEQLLLSFYEPEYDKRKATRVASMKQEAERAQKSAEQKRKSDL